MFFLRCTNTCIIIIIIIIINVIMLFINFRSDWLIAVDMHSAVTDNAL